MRTRKEIEREVVHILPIVEQLTIELLLDIRELLEVKEKTKIINTVAKAISENVSLRKAMRGEDNC